MKRITIGLLAAAALSASVTAGCTSSTGGAGHASGSGTPAGAAAPAGTASAGSVGSAGSTPPVTAGTGSIVSKQAVLRPADAPAGTRYLASASGPRTIADLVKGDQDAAKESALLHKAGFQNAYLSILTGLQLPESVLRGHLVASFAVVFGTPSAAVTGLGVLARTAAATATKPTPVAVSQLGPHVQALHIQLNTFAGDSYLICWQQHNTVRVLVDAGGTGVVSLADATRLAHTVAAADDRQVTAEDAPKLVLQPAAAPADTTLAAARSGSRTVTQFAPAKADTARLRQLGFAAGYVNQYLSAGLASPHPPSTQSSRRQSDYIASEAQQYSSHGAAKQAYTLFSSREQRLLRGQAATVPLTGLGPDAGGFRYVDHKRGGDLIGYAYFWCEGNLMLTLFDVGTTSFATPATAQHLAALMAQHARG